MGTGRALEDGKGGEFRIAVTGAGGLIGGALLRLLREKGFRVDRLVRRSPAGGDDEIFWNPETGEIDRAALEGVRGIVHLAGENIAAGRWTRARMRSIRESRLKGTKLLAGTIASLEQRPDGIGDPSLRREGGAGEAGEGRFPFSPSLPRDGPGSGRNRILSVKQMAE